jgi:glycosyltransferase involved in cell wall biosynthesis
MLATVSAYSEEAALDGQRDRKGESARSVAVIGTRGYPSHYGGFETAIRELAPYLASRGWQVTVYGRRDSTSTDDVKRDCRVASKTTLGIDSKSISTLSYGLTSTVQTAFQRPDVALVMNVANGYWLPLLRASNVPTLVNVDGIEWERTKWGKTARAVFRVGAQVTAKLADAIVYDSREIGRRWAELFGREGVYIPYGGKDPGRLALEPGLRHHGYVLMVARLVPENTVEEFAKAAETLAANYEVVIVGSSGHGGDLEVRISRLAKDFPRIRWLGHIYDDRRLMGLWQHAGAYFHGHSVGGTNPSLVQAMACGSPIIARDTSFNREVLGPEFQYVQPTPSAIVAAVDKVMSDGQLRESLSRTGKMRAANEYTWASVNAKYEEALSLLASSRKRGAR